LQHNPPDAAQSIRNFLKDREGSVPWAQTSLAIAGTAGFAVLFPEAFLVGALAYATALDQLSSLVAAGQAKASEFATVVTAGGIIRKMEFISTDNDGRYYLRLDYIYATKVGDDAKEYLVRSSVYPVRSEKYIANPSPR
jgi:hypothetical protein